MIVIDDILELHKKSIIDFGGSHGIRDIALFESAIARPFQSLGGEDLYVTVYDKAAALGESLIMNHPFVDGNKRTGMLAMLSFLMNNNILNASSEELYKFIIDISTGSIGFEKIATWLKENSVKVR